MKSRGKDRRSRSAAPGTSDKVAPGLNDRPSASNNPPGPPQHTRNAPTILIIDNDDALRDSLREQLVVCEEFNVLLAATAFDGLKLARNGRLDLVLLDVCLPDLDGFMACKLIRRGGFKGPIFMLTAHASDADTILGLESGANDYVTTPVKLDVLLARIRAQLRRHEQTDAVFTIGAYIFKPASKLLVGGDGGKIRLTQKETSILTYLYSAGEQVISRDRLLRDVWGYQAGVVTRTVDTYIYRLRQKIEKDPSQAKLLITVAGGYRLMKTVES